MWFSCSALALGKLLICWLNLRDVWLWGSIHILMFGNLKTLFAEFILSYQSPILVDNVHSLYFLLNYRIVINEFSIWLTKQNEFSVWLMKQNPSIAHNANWNQSYTFRLKKSCLKMFTFYKFCYCVLDTYYKNNSILAVGLCLCAFWVAFSCFQLFATPWTVAHHSPVSMGFRRQEY